jgi:hypothetical protein
VWLDNKYKTKRLELYKKEKIEIDANGKIKNFEKVLFEFR